MRLRAILPVLLALLAVLAVLRRRRAAALPAPSAAAVPAPAALPDPDPRPSGPRFVSVPWELAATPADAPELAIRFTRSEHMTLDRIDVLETPTQVFLTVLVRWEPPAGGWFAYDRDEPASVALQHALGERELIHGAIDAL